MGQKTPRKAPPQPAAPFAWRLVVMVKLPMAGGVKTRLAREIGAVQATRFYRNTMRSVVQRLVRAPFWETYLAVSPDAGRLTRMLPPATRRIPQGVGNLGQRMQRPMRSLPPGPVCLIGSDIPAVNVRDIRQAFQQLGRCEVVFGPAEDGGFWLVGMRRRPMLINPYLGVPWSQPDTLARAEWNLEGRVVGRTTRLADVDNACDLASQGSAAGRLVRPR